MLPELVRSGLRLNLPRYTVGVLQVVAGLLHLLFCVLVQPGSRVQPYTAFLFGRFEEFVFLSNVHVPFPPVAIRLFLRATPV